jgi:hypothetical protein
VKEWRLSVENEGSGGRTFEDARCLKSSRARAHNLIETVLEGALESQRTKGTAEELLRLYLIGKRLYYTPAEELLRLR